MFATIRILVEIIEIFLRYINNNSILPTRLLSKYVAISLVIIIVISCLKLCTEIDKMLDGRGICIFSVVKSTSSLRSLFAIRLHFFGMKNDPVIKIFFADEDI